ncbi:MAG: PASTA domain-containing protein [Synergistaceae bacterium]|nr:PASTA domain-containing protein [Synergistaceae bacterium]
MRMRKHNGGIVLTTIFFVAAIIFASGAIAVYTVFMKPEGKSQVPNFRDSSIVDAVAEAEKLGLVVQLEHVASTIAEGRVLAQTPEPGTELRKGLVVVLQVSKGGELHDVPDVKGMTVTDAQAEIKAQGFTMGDVVKVREPKFKAGEVIAQSPSSPAKAAAGRKIDLLVQDGADANGVITVPDVNRMTEKEAREVLTAAGLKVQGVDRVYSPLLPEGLAIETRPGAGSVLRAGQGVILKLATQRRPAGYMGADSKVTTTENGTARRVSSQRDTDNNPASKTQPSKTTAQTPPQKTPEPPKNDEEEFVGQDDYTAMTPSPQKTSSTPPANTPSTPPATTPAPSTPPATSSGGTKTAKIRYPVPPIGRPMNLRIEVVDPSGKRDILSRQVKGGETVSATANYTQECIITVYLGGEAVWNDKRN